MKKANKHKIIVEESILIIYEHNVIEFYNNLEYDEKGNVVGKTWTLNKILNYVKKMFGYTAGVILVICESYLHGKIYRYGNTLDNEWWEVGKMEGFA